MSLNWKTMSLDEVIVKRNQGVNTTTEKVEYSETGVKVIRANNISTGIVDYSNCVYVAEETFGRIKDACKPQKGDILYTNIGSQFGNAALVNTDENFVIAWNVLRLQPSNKINADFLVYLLNNPSNKKMIQSLNSSSTMPFVSGGEIGKVEFSFPDLNKQAAIAKILRSLDDKIYTNNKINQTLEFIAQAIFKSWFIDFDPVCAKITAKQEGKDTELAAMCVISGKSETELKQMSEDDFAELQATAAFFPDELVESELGEVPKGWEISKISKIGKVVTGKTPSSKIENSFAEEGTLFITPTDIDTEIFVTNTNRYLSEHGEIAIKNSSVNAGSLCITCIGSQMGKVVITPKRAFTNQQINSILLFDNSLRNYIFLNLRQRRDEIFLIGSGGSTMPIINKSTFESLNLILPGLNLIRKFDNFINPFFNNILKNSVENIEIKNMRDLLLPELLSGKINLSMLKDM